MVDNGRGGRRAPSRSLTRDPSDEKIYREGKRHKRDDKRKRDDDGIIVDDENPQILEFWWWKPDDNGHMEQVVYYHDVTKEGPMSQVEIEKRRPFRPTDPHIVPGPNQPNAMEPKAKACGNKPSPKGTSDESRVGGFFNPNAPQAPPGVSDQAREGGFFDQHGRTDERGWSGWGERSWSARGWDPRSWADHGRNEPPKAVAPPPRMQPAQAPQAMHKAAPAGAPAAHAAAAGKQIRVCKPTSSPRLGVWQNANNATPLAIEAGTGKDMPIPDKPTAKDARHVDMPVGAAPGNVHRPDQQKHGAGGEDHELPLWAQNIVDITNDDRLDDDWDPDPEDQCELASPATRLLTASGYNRQH
jgi:hypothetical protein